MMSWYTIGGSYSQSVKGNPGIFEEPFRIKNIKEFVIKRQILNLLTQNRSAIEGPEENTPNFHKSKRKHFRLICDLLN